VVQSSIRRFRAQVEQLSAIADRVPGNWRSERVSDQTQQIVREFCHPNMSRHDAAALMWYARNILYFEQDLPAHRDVFLCRYEDLVANPEDKMIQLYRFLDLEYPESSLTDDVDRQSLGLGSDVPLNKDVEELCEKLQQQLERSLIRRPTSTAAMTP
jgi:hypothetical protein